MKRPPRLRLVPHPSRIACASIALCCVATAILVALLPMPFWTKGVGILAVVSVAVRGIWRCAGRGVPALVHVGDDRRLTVTRRDGTSFGGVILDDTYVGARLTTIVWRPDCARWWQPARTLLFWADTLPVEDFRRLRVLLRYGVPDARGERKDVDAD
jgi:hypothetical protein